MTPADMAEKCREVIEVYEARGLESEPMVTFVYPMGHKKPKGFPRGELLGFPVFGGKTWTAYSFNARRVLAWLEKSGLLA